MGRYLMQELGLDIKFLYCMIRGESPELFEECYTSMKCFQEVIDKYLNNDIISDEIYDGKPVKDITDRATPETGWFEIATYDDKNQWP